MLPATCGVYCITNEVTGKKYVGSSRNIKARVRFHLLGHGSTSIAKAIEKHGRESFRSEVLELCSEGEQYAAEDRWIKELRPAYNQTSFEVGRHHTLETREKIRQSKLGHVTPQAVRDKISASGKVRVISAEAAERMREANRRPKRRPVDIGARISAAKKGKPLTAEHREALRKAWVIRKEKSRVRPES